MSNALTLKKRLCLNIAEHIERQEHLERTSYNVDRVAKLIAAMIPHSHDEAIQEADELTREMPPDPAAAVKQKSAFDALREACGLEPGTSIFGVIETAANLLKLHYNPNRRG